VFGRTGVVNAEQTEQRTVVESIRVKTSELAAAEMAIEELDCAKRTSCVI
jgi:hypothetical protein